MDFNAILTRCLLPIGMITASIFGGYFARRLGAVGEDRAKPMLTVVAVVGYPLIGFLAIWQIDLQLQHIWLPTLGLTQVTLLTLIGLAIGRKLFADRADQGLFGVAMALGNCGITMAGFVIFLLAGEDGLGRSQIYNLYWQFAVVFLAYTTARHYSPTAPRRSFGRLVAGSLLNWRAIGLPTGIAAVCVSASGIERPAFFDDYHIVKIIIYVQIVAAYFAIGLRLHVSHVWAMRKMISAVLVLRHGVGFVLGLGLLGLTMLTPVPMTGMDRTVFLIQSSIPVAVTAAAVANMFGLHPRKASVLFVVSSLLYLLIGLPLIFILAG